MYYIKIMLRNYKNHVIHKRECVSSQASQAYFRCCLHFPILQAINFRMVKVDVKKGCCSYTPFCASPLMMDAPQVVDYMSIQIGTESCVYPLLFLSRVRVLCCRCLSWTPRQRKNIFLISLFSLLLGVLKSVKNIAWSPSKACSRKVGANKKVAISFSHSTGSNKEVMRISCRKNKEQRKKKKKGMLLSYFLLFNDILLFLFFTVRCFRLASIDRYTYVHIVVISQ